MTSIKVAFRSLGAHRLRTGLTMLGIVIGVAAVLVMVAVGNGASERISAQIRSLGANLINVFPGSAKIASVRLGRGEAPRLNEDDARAIELEIPGVVAVAPLLYARGQFTVGASNWSGSLRGTTPGYFTAREWNVVAGREMTPEDDERATKVVLLGATMHEKLFGDADPVGAQIRIRDVPFTVIGLLGRKGQSVWGDDQDDVALVPLTTARRQFVGISRASPRQVHNISVKFAEGTSADATMVAIRDLLHQRHRLQPSQEETFVVQNLAEIAGAEKAATSVLSLLLAAVASVSLVVGGIGIMNIMLATVTERTREIGLRLAVGARQRDILAQFLIEAVTLSLLGGVLGAIVGIAAAAAIAAFVQWQIVIDVGALFLAIGFAGAVGIFFGFYPAAKAARLNPIVALRRD
ncbi:MAG: FtsX-like permease family protein [Alphaproteobacteria bacterium]|nr:FtsX-like permease family protein [Alphaproteobacteria bacterium]